MGSLENLINKYCFCSSTYVSAFGFVGFILFIFSVSQQTSKKSISVNKQAMFVPFYEHSRLDHVDVGPDCAFIRRIISDSQIQRNLKIQRVWTSVICSYIISLFAALFPRKTWQTDTKWIKWIKWICKKWTQFLLGHLLIEFNWYMSGRCKIFMSRHGHQVGSSVARVSVPAVWSSDPCGKNQFIL